MITSQDLDSLSDREILIFDMLLRRKSYGEMSCELAIPTNSLSYSIGKIYFKLRVRGRSRTDLIRVWNDSITAQKEKFKGYDFNEKV